MSLKERILQLSILDVADKLQLKYYGRDYAKYRQCRCFMHDDHHPSLWLKTTNNTWHCPVCDKGGDIIALVMEHENLTYPEALKWLAKEFGIPTYDDHTPYRPVRSQQRKPRSKPQPATKTSSLIPNPLSLIPNPLSLKPSPFTRALVTTGILTEAQMQEAMRLYRLGATDDGGVIFWMIDAQQRVLDGKIMFYLPDCHRDHSRHPSTVSSRLIRRGMIPADWQRSTCLFGLHLLAATSPADIVAIVESEKTAIICSQRIGGIWLATGGLSGLTPESLLPLRGHRLILFPDTDPDGTTYRRWLSIAEEASQLLRCPVTVSDLLERLATPEQKQRKIDIADLLTNPLPLCKNS